MSTDSKLDVAKCIQETGNWSKVQPVHKFDSKSFDPAEFRKHMHVAGPKLEALIKKIRELDAKDFNKHGRYFKHFIYSDIKSVYGAKLIASALAANGFTHSYALKNTPRGQSFQLEPLPSGTPDTFATMTSVSFFEKPIGVNFRRELLRRFNARPSNVYGKDLRIIILDSGFREGVDLFDVKYVHLFEPIITAADQKQAIGRATRFCGQKGLTFHPTKGWPLKVFKYETTIPRHVRAYIMSAAPHLLTRTEDTFFDLFIKFTNVDPRKITFARELDSVVVDGAVDKSLTRGIHEFGLGAAVKGGTGTKSTKAKATKAKAAAPNYMQFMWPPAKMENGCDAPPSGSLDFSPTQNFVRHYLNTKLLHHGLLAYHSVGTGKTCTAIATATSSFEQEGWTILYVTKHTLKADVWKNMFDQSCSVILKQAIAEGTVIPKDQASRMRMISKSWKAVQPLSYRQFSNMLEGKNESARVMKEINGSTDMLKKTFVIIDEAHKLFASDVVGAEKGDVDVIRAALHNSYVKSGADAAKVLLMTGTPYTDDPMDLMRLVNLIRSPDSQFPEDYDAFATKYLTPDGKFSEKGRDAFMKGMAGLVSYLNREKDARTFAYPVIHDVKVPMSLYEFEAELDEFIINAETTKLRIKTMKDKEDGYKLMSVHIKKQHDQIIKDVTKKLAECKKNGQAKAAAKENARIQTSEARERAKASKKGCPTGKRTDANAKAAKAECVDRINAELKATLAEIKRNAAATVAAGLGSAGCDDIKRQIDKAKSDAKAAIDANKRAHDNMVSVYKTTIAKDKLTGKTLNSALKTMEKEDHSQQQALDDCLHGIVTPAVKQMKQGILAPDMDIGSRSASSPVSVDQPSVFIISGHGQEKYVKFNERRIMPPGSTLVVFSTCFKPNFMDNACNFMDVFVNRERTDLLSDPVTNKKEIERILKAPIRVYAPGDHVPKLETNLFLDFAMHKTAIVKSGVFRVPNLPTFIGPHNNRDDLIIGENNCMRFTQFIRSPANYGASVHKNVFEGNLYKKASKMDNFKALKHRSFSVEDIMTKVGPGVYYSISCRSTHDNMNAAQLREVYDHSEEQQQAKA